MEQHVTPPNTLGPMAPWLEQAWLARYLDGLLEADEHTSGRAVLTLRGRLLADAVVRALLP